MKKIALIGSTGSIGKQVLNVVRRYKEEFSIVSLAGGENVDLLQAQINEFCPVVACSKNYFMPSSKAKVEYFFGENAFTNAILDSADIVVVALVGFKGILAVLDCINKGKNIALANKESLVVGGRMVMELAKEKGVNIYPIDSEHSAIWQALSFDFNKPFNKLLITASGGAFRDLSEEQLNSVTAKDALMHPNWNMGAKITVDCATLVNKAFEVIEAKWLYNTTINKIDVIMHRESIIHSMVEYIDGSVIAQMSYPTMEIPIQMALTYPNRLKCNNLGLDLAKLGKLSFSELNREKYPAFELVINSAKKGGVYPAIANGANDSAVKLFLQDKIAFKDIYRAIDGALCAYNQNFNDDIEGLLLANDFANAFVKDMFGVK